MLTTILLHKRHAVPILPLAGNYSPQKGGPVDKTLVNDPPPEWYHVANWSPTPGATRWPAWDVILSLWLSGDLLLTPDVKSIMATRRRRSRSGSTKRGTGTIRARKAEDVITHADRATGRADPEPPARP